jgi:alpha-galactosidase/6-phospho-beta-glucosidase family protein
MLLDPFASRIDYDLLRQMTDEMLAATKPWLPQFA